MFNLRRLINPKAENPAFRDVYVIGSKAVATNGHIVIFEHLKNEERDKLIEKTVFCREQQFFQVEANIKKHYRKIKYHLKRNKLVNIRRGFTMKCVDFSTNSCSIMLPVGDSCEDCGGVGYYEANSCNEYEWDCKTYCPTCIGIGQTWPWFSREVSLNGIVADIKYIRILIEIDAAFYARQKTSEIFFKGASGEIGCLMGFGVVR